MNTPWGESQSITLIADGIQFVSTPSHGGFLLTPERREAMPQPYQSIQTFAGGNWYEEDCDYALVMLAFPQYFIKLEVDMARAVYGRYHKEIQ